MFFAALSVGDNRIVLSGALTTTSASSPVTSSTRTVTRGAGLVEFDSVSSDGGTPQYSKNAGAYTDITEGMTLALATGDTLAVRASLTIVAQKANFNLRFGSSVSSPLIESVQLTRS